MKQHNAQTSWSSFTYSGILKILLIVFATSGFVVRGRRGRIVIVDIVTISVKRSVFDIA